MEYNVQEDLNEIKKQIKTWELELDRIVSDSLSGVAVIPEEVSLALEELSHEMMAINI